LHNLMVGRNGLAASARSAHILAGWTSGGATIGVLDAAACRLNTSAAAGVDLVASRARKFWQGSLPSDDHARGLGLLFAFSPFFSKDRVVLGAATLDLLASGDGGATWQLVHQMKQALDDCPMLPGCARCRNAKPVLSTPQMKRCSPDSDVCQYCLQCAHGYSLTEWRHCVRHTAPTITSQSTKPVKPAPHQQLVSSLDSQGVGIPTAIVQYGEPRSASTFQFTLLCVITRMLHPSTSVPCRYEATVNLAGTVGGSASPLVIKTHNPPKDGPFAVFTSTRKKGTQLWAGALYSQDLGSVVADDLAEVSKYMDIFQLNTSQVQQIRDFLPLWSIQRQCCGIGQSLANRQRLHGCPVTADQHGAQCLTQNMTNVELQFLQTPLYPYRYPGDYMPGRCAREELAIRNGAEWPAGTNFTTCEALRGGA